MEPLLGGGIGGTRSDLRLVNSAAQWFAVVLAIAAANMSTGIVIVSARRRGHPVGLTWIDVLRGVVAAGTLVVGAIAAGLATFRLDLFGVVSVVYFAVVVGAPAVALLLLGWWLSDRRARTVSRPVAVLVVPALLAGVMGIWGSAVAPYRLEVDRPELIAVPSARTGSQTIRIGVLTDLQAAHIGDYERSAIDLLMAQEPDLILLPGDILQADAAGHRRARAAVRELFGRLHAPGGVFVVPGDTDTYWPDTTDSLDPFVEGTDVRVLRNEIITTRVHDRSVRIAGLKLNYGSPAAAETASALESEVGDDDVRILLAHRPDAVDLLPSSPRTDLVVAGHTHGGQISVPGVGPLITMSGVPRAVAAGGLHWMGARRIYIGRGVGMERSQAPPVRLGVPPNIGILTVGSS